MKVTFLLYKDLLKVQSHANILFFDFDIIFENSPDPDPKSKIIFSLFGKNFFSLKKYKYKNSDFKQYKIFLFR